MPTYWSRCSSSLSGSTMGPVPRDRPYRDCVIEAAQVRLRPILLTSITTVAGLLPVACGIGGSDPFSVPMALAIGYGILFATALTLVLLPSLLVVLDDANRMWVRLGDWLWVGANRG